MKLLTKFFASAATKFPIITIIVILGITGFFGYMTTGGSGTQSVLQLVF